MRFLKFIQALCLRLVIIGLSIVLLFFISVVFQRLVIHNGMKELNNKLGVAESPPFGCRPISYYRTYFETKIQTGMSSEEIADIVKNFNSSEKIIGDHGSKYGIRYCYHFSDYGIINFSVYVRVMYDDKDRALSCRVLDYY